jgi:hypothetical protein
MRVMRWLLLNVYGASDGKSKYDLLFSKPIAAD